MAAGAEKTIGKAVPKVSCSLNSNPTRTVASLFPFTAHFHPLRSPSACGTFGRKSATARYSRYPKASDRPSPLPVGSPGAHCNLPRPNTPALILKPVSAFHHSHSLTRHVDHTASSPFIHCDRKPFSSFLALFLLQAPHQSQRPRKSAAADGRGRNQSMGAMSWRASHTPASCSGACV